MYSVSDGSNIQKRSGRSFYKAGEAVEIRWDSECLDPGEEPISAVVLKESKWNKQTHSRGCWRMDDVVNFNIA